MMDVRKVFTEMYGLDEEDSRLLENLLMYIYYKKPLPEHERRKWTEKHVLSKEGKVIVFPIYALDYILHPCMLIFLLLSWYDEIDYGLLVGAKKGDGLLENRK
jgi:hypothetical protein